MEWLMRGRGDGPSVFTRTHYLGTSSPFEFVSRLSTFRPSMNWPLLFLPPKQYTPSFFKSYILLAVYHSLFGFELHSGRDAMVGYPVGVLSKLVGLLTRIEQQIHYHYAAHILFLFIYAAVN